MKKRLEIRIDKEVHDILTRITQKRNISINKLIIRALFEKLIRDRDIEILKQ